MTSVKKQMENAGYNFGVMTVRGKCGVQDRPETVKEHSYRVKAVERIINKLIDSTEAYAHIFDNHIDKKPQDAKKKCFQLCEELLNANCRKLREELGIMAR